MRRTILILLACTLFFCGLYTNNVKATSLEVGNYPLSEEDRNSLLDKTNVQSVRTVQNKPAIQCFDVKSDGTVAIGTGSGSNCMVCVYDPSGVFQYGLRFCSDGDYGVLFQDDAIGIFFLRGNTIMLFDSSGVCVDIQKVCNPNRGHKEIKEILNRTSKEVAGKQYVLERDFNLGDSYSRLVILNGAGERTVLYDVTIEQNVGQILRVAAVICFFVAVAWGCMKKLKTVKSE